MWNAPRQAHTCTGRPAVPDSVVRLLAGRLCTAAHTFTPQGADLWSLLKVFRRQQLMEAFVGGGEPRKALHTLSFLHPTTSLLASPSSRRLSRGGGLSLASHASGRLAASPSRRLLHGTSGFSVAGTHGHGALGSPSRAVSRAASRSAPDRSLQAGQAGSKSMGVRWGAGAEGSGDGGAACEPASPGSRPASRQGSRQSIRWDAQEPTPKMKPVPASLKLQIPGQEVAAPQLAAPTPGKYQVAVGSGGAQAELLLQLHRAPKACASPVPGSHSQQPRQQPRASTPASPHPPLSPAVIQALAAGEAPTLQKLLQLQALAATVQNGPARSPGRLSPGPGRTRSPGPGGRYAAAAGDSTGGRGCLYSSGGQPPPSPSRPASSVADRLLLQMPAPFVSLSHAYAPRRVPRPASPGAPVARGMQQQQQRPATALGHAGSAPPLTTSSWLRPASALDSHTLAPWAEHAEHVMAGGAAQQERPGPNAPSPTLEHSHVSPGGHSQAAHMSDSLGSPASPDGPSTEPHLPHHWAPSPSPAGRQPGPPVRSRRGGPPETVSCPAYMAHTPSAHPVLLDVQAPVWADPLLHAHLPPWLMHHVVPGFGAAAAVAQLQEWRGSAEHSAAGQEGRRSGEGKSTAAPDDGCGGNSGDVSGEGSYGVPSPTAPASSRQPHPASRLSGALRAASLPPAAFPATGPSSSAAVAAAGGEDELDALDMEVSRTLLSFSGTATAVSPRSPAPEERALQAGPASVSRASSGCSQSARASRVQGVIRPEPQRAGPAASHHPSRLAAQSYAGQQQLLLPDPASMPWPADGAGSGEEKQYGGVEGCGDGEVAHAGGDGGVEAWARQLQDPDAAWLLAALQGEEGHEAAPGPDQDQDQAEEDEEEGRYEDGDEDGGLNWGDDEGDDAGGGCGPGAAENGLTAAEGAAQDPTEALGAGGQVAGRGSTSGAAAVVRLNRATVMRLQGAHSKSNKALAVAAASWASRVSGSGAVGAAFGFSSMYQSLPTQVGRQSVSGASRPSGSSGSSRQSSMGKGLLQHLAPRASASGAAGVRLSMSGHGSEAQNARERSSSACGAHVGGGCGNVK